MGNWPNINALICNAWGAGGEFQSTWPANLFRGASNLVLGTNPAYTLDDFFDVCQKFFGLSTPLSGCTTTGGIAVVSVPSVAGLRAGQFIQAVGILAPGSVILSVGVGTVTLNQGALVSASNVTAQTYRSAPIPVAVIQLYLNLAAASLVQAHWQDAWTIAMALFIAHYCTLFAKSDATEVATALQASTHGEVPVGAVPGTTFTLSAPPPGGVLQSLTKNGVFLVPVVDYALNGPNITLTVSTAVALYAVWTVQTATFTTGQASGAAIAAQGLAGGIQTSKGVGDVSVSYQPLDSLKDWGTWNLTSYGQQLATMAKVVGMGPMLIW